MEIKVNDTTVTVPDAVLTDFLGFLLIGKDYRNPSYNWGTVLNENTLKTALSIESLRSALASVYTKSETDTAIDDRINFLVGSAPQNLDTLYEIALKLNEDDSVISQLFSLLNQKSDVSHTHTKRFISSTSTQLSRPVGSYYNLFYTVLSSFGDLSPTKLAQYCSSCW